VIEYVSGDLLKSKAQTLVVPVNTVGVMGAGLAWQFAKAYPKIVPRYKWRCDVRYPDDRDFDFRAGKIWLCRLQPDRWIICFATKSHWSMPSKLEWIEAGLQDFALYYKIRGITSVAFPKLGCGLGGLDWNDVKPVMEDYLMPLDLNVQIYTRR